MRHYLVFQLFFITCILFVQPARAQTIVSTLPQNKNVVLEEFGGINCVYCPEGHAISTAVAANNTNRVILLNYHTGPYAQPGSGDPDLRSPFGADIKLQTGLTGYPAATINRRVFPGMEQGSQGTTALGREHWAQAAQEVLAQPSPVNIAATATLNVASRELSLLVEYYYTGDASEVSNWLHIAVLQNHILGPQLGGNQGDYYPHQQVVRDFLTGQWGELISNPVAGQLGSRSFTMVLPEFYQNVAVDPANIELAVFISETRQQIVSGIRVRPLLVSPYTLDARLLAVITEPVICGEGVSAVVKLRNDGQQSIDNLSVAYGIDGGAMDSLSWQGNLQPFEIAEFVLPSLPIETEGTQGLYVILENPNGQADNNPVNNQRTSSFRTAGVSAQQVVRLDLRTDDYGYETYWEITDDAGTVWASGGNELVGQNGGGLRIAAPSNPGAYGNNQFVSEVIALPADGCYALRLLDDFGDGMCCDYGNGFFRLRQQGGAVLIYGNAYGSEERQPFRVRTPVVSVNEPMDAVAQELRVYPNPLRSEDRLMIAGIPQALLPVHWELVSASGRRVAEGSLHDLSASIPTSSLPPGYYYLGVRSEQGSWGHCPVWVLPGR
jgi:hypothetical protein